MAIFKFLTIGEVSARSGVSVSALRFYETKDLIGGIRTSGNQRRYGQGILRRIALIHFAQGLGISLAEIGEALSTLPRDRNPTPEEWHLVASSWNVKLAARIADLTRMKDRLEDCIGCGCLSMEKCPLRNREDRLAQKGSGPRLLLKS
ncbi:redox-sensitive transcriptional activator SoxR [Aestuariivirga litoralis]|uniref:redox-sensitive transcriptional activator SoxR n=1 Tax=Aestuariivirga litoralis TaxID=2650924 RepID=UPI001AEE5990|nr:redox-sensitive transcriptional activator SoxR [Aestuariivirga litoralis]